ncbi:hypothetical protein GCM10025874_21350 [Arenivirga flava]|uniref:FAD-binding domain-containing protein n=2 Tax=Arenivirga flava TaxID=1930060 RepID=A0AA37UUQ7_9MICO|nr:hypothetical protein GCM10025874_21350 [Arenivirga flava]
MGLTDQVREQTTTEAGTRFVNDDGAAIGEFPAEEGVDGPTAELEILRGDLARIIRDALPATVSMQFGVSVDTVDQTTNQPTATLTDGSSHTVDLVVIAEGVRSRTREALFPSGVELNPLELAMVYGTITRTDGDDRWWNWFTTNKQRQVTLRPDNRGTTRATMAYVSAEDRLSDATPEEQIAILRDVFTDAGWQSERVLDGFAASDDIYVDYLTQVKMNTWSRGHVVATGDAAWCVTPLGGGGCSLAITGGYVLAASLSTEPSTEEALQAYEAWMRPLIDDCQKLPPGGVRLAYPKTTAGVKALRAGMRAASSGPVRKIAAKAMGDVADAERPLPDIRTARP